jgi:hypothetical protein
VQAVLSWQSIAEAAAVMHSCAACAWCKFSEQASSWVLSTYQPGLAMMHMQLPYGCALQQGTATSRRGGWLQNLAGCLHHRYLLSGQIFR